MELRHLRYFVAVAEELHFGRAAKRLFMAQPPLSQQIRQLEDEIGTPLFIRANRRVQLTAAGTAFLDEARIILARVEQAVSSAQRAGRGETGWFGVGFVASAIYDVLPRILRRFREQFPDVELVLTEVPGVEQCKALHEKRIHAGFSRLPIPEEGIILEPVTHDTLMIALPAGHKLASCRELRLRELSSEVFILYPSEPESNYTSYMLRLCVEAGFTPNVVQKTGNIQTAVSLVDAGVGIAIVPASAKNLRREGVVYRRLVDPIPTIDLTLSYRIDDPSPILPHFIEIVHSTIREERPSP